MLVFHYEPSPAHLPHALTRNKNVFIKRAWILAEISYDTNAQVLSKYAN